MTRLTQPNKRDRSQPENVGLPASHKPGKLYVFVHYEAGWYWTDKLIPGTTDRYGWLPRPQAAQAQPGVNGCQDPGRNKPMTRAHMTGMLAALQAKGAKLLEPEDARLGPYQYYDEYYDTQEGGRSYIEPGQEFTILRNGAVLSNADEVGAKTLEFHRFLRDEAAPMIHPFMREVYLRAMATEREKLGRCEQAAGVTPGLAYKVERQIARIAMMEEDYAAYEATLAHEAVKPSPAKSEGRKLRLKTAATAEDPA